MNHSSLNTTISSVRVQGLDLQGAKGDLESKSLDLPGTKGLLLLLNHSPLHATVSSVRVLLITAEHTERLVEGGMEHENEYIKQLMIISFSFTEREGGAFIFIQ